MGHEEIKREQIKRIRDDPTFSDAYLVARRIIPELLDTAITDDFSRGLRGKKDYDELELIKYIAKTLGNINSNVFYGMNQKHDILIKNLKKINEDYGQAILGNDPFLIKEARLGLLMNIIQNHPSRFNLTDFLGRVDPIEISETHSKLLTTVFFDLNPNLGYLMNENKDLTIEHVLEAINHVEISGGEARIQFNKHSELSKMLIKHFIHESKENDGIVDPLEKGMIRVYGDMLFGYDDAELVKIAEETDEENKLVGSFSKDLKNLPRLKLDSDLEKKVRKRVINFIDVTNKAFEDNQFSSQEEAICHEASKYFGIRAQESYNSIINYCKKKVIIANGNSNLSKAISDLLNRTAITPLSMQLSAVYDYVKENNPLAVIVDLDKGVEAAELILKLKDCEFDGRLYGIKSKGVKPGNEKELAMQYGVDMCFSTFNPMRLKAYLKEDLGLNK